MFEVDNKKVIRIIIFLFLFIFFGKLFFYQFGNFLFFSGYEKFIIWYPDYHLSVYVCVQLIKFISVIGLLYFFWKKKSYVIGLIKYINSVKNFTIESVYLVSTGKNRTHNYEFTNIINFLFDSAKAFNIQLLISRIYLSLSIVVVIIFIYTNAKTSIFRVITFLFQPTAPYNITTYRITFFLILALLYFGYAFNEIIYVESKPREPLPFIGWMIEIIPISKKIYFFTCITGILCCVFIVMGLFTRYFLILNAILVFYIVSVPNFYGKLWHSQLPIWISWFLLFAPVSDIFSLDKKLFNKSKILVKSSAYNFPIKIIWLQIGIIYFWAGYHKIYDCGFEWALGNTMINQVRLEWFEHYDKIPFLRIDNYPFLLHIGGVLVILFELLYWYFLFFPKLKYISIIGGLLMHNLIGIFMYIAFPTLQMQYIVFINYEKLLNWYNILSKKKTFELNLQNTNQLISKPLIFFSFFVLVMNFLFGMMKISSFPFSVYPTYSELVNSEKEYLHYEIIDSDKKQLNVRELGKKNNFRWENFSRKENTIIKKIQKDKKIDTAAIYNQWKWWANEIIELKDVDTVKVYVMKRNLNPDSSHLLPSDSTLLITLFPQKKL
jgi:hypothetical protein